MNTTPSPVTLAPPGAGLPWLEGKLSRLGLRIFSRLTDRERALSRFLADGEHVLALAEPLDEPAGRRPVLIPRLPGMEDSSRCWSPYMIVEHLVIVDHAILGTISLLASGKTLNRKVRTADVKPSPDAGPETLAAFRGLLADWPSKLSGIGRLRATARHPHPWFGPLDAHGWLCLATIHHGIHLRQLERVLAGMRQR